MNHWSVDDNQLEILLESGKLDPGLFSHEAHIRLAWNVLQKMDLKEAENRIRFLLMTYVSHLGLNTKYHETITLASIRLVRNGVQTTEALTCAEFLLSNPILISDFKTQLLRHYSKELLFSESARQSFVEPDLLPFD